MSVNRIDLDPELASEPRRHTDGVQSRNSKRAITNRDSSHDNLAELRSSAPTGEDESNARDEGDATKDW